MAVYYGLTKHMEILLKSDFLQFKLLSSKDFVKYLCDRGVQITLECLEYYDRKEVIRPALRLHSPETYFQDPKNGFLSRDSFSMHYYHIHGLNLGLSIMIMVTAAYKQALGEEYFSGF